MIPILFSLAACGSSDTEFGAGGNDVTVPDGDATMQLSADWFDWSGIVVGYSSSQELTVSSVGDGALSVYEMKLVTNPDAAFFFDEVEDIRLEPGQEVTYAVVADLDVGWDLSTYAEGTLRIRTNDVECTEALLRLRAYPEGYTGPHDDDTASPPVACP